jgi:hypothetical protein
MGGKKKEKKTHWDVGREREGMEKERRGLEILLRRRKGKRKKEKQNCWEGRKGTRKERKLMERKVGKIKRNRKKIKARGKEKKAKSEGCQVIQHGVVNLVFAPVGVLDAPYSAKPAQLSRHTGPPGYIVWIQFQPM